MLRFNNLLGTNVSVPPAADHWVAIASPGFAAWYWRQRKLGAGYYRYLAKRARRRQRL